MKTTKRNLVPLIGAAGLAAALLAAPPAIADTHEDDNSTLPQCVDTGGSAALGGSTTECETPGNTSIDATPSEPEFGGPWGDMWGGEGYFFP